MLLPCALGVCRLLSRPLPALLFLVALLASIHLIRLVMREPSLRDPTILYRPLPMRRWAPLPQRVVVSLSTMGGRSQYLVRSLPSILNQTYRPTQVIVSISKVWPPWSS